jgi:ketosteroid isomerase-like protein
MKIKVAAALALLLMFAGSGSQAQTGDVSMDKAAILKTIETMTGNFAAGNIDGVMATYESGAVVVGQPSQPVSGHEALRAMFQQFVEQGVAFTYGAHEVVVAGDVALHLMKWTAPNPQGDMSALSVAVLRRQPDGTWKMVIDHPFGDAVMHAPAN